MYKLFNFNQLIFNYNNTLLDNVDSSNLYLDLTIDYIYYTSDEFNLNHNLTRA